MARGFTLVELLVTMTIIVVLAGIGLPAWRSFSEEARLQALAGGYLHAFNTARTTAVMTGRNISLCPVDAEEQCTARWGDRLATFEDDDRDGRPASPKAIIDLLQVPAAADASVTLRAFGRTSHVSLRRDGRYRQNGTFRFCLPGSARGRAIVINVTGRARTEALACPP